MRQGRIKMSLSADERQIINTAISGAEQRTAGEIVCVLAGASGDYLFYPIAWAALAALISPWVMMILTHASVERIFLIQLVVFGVVFLFCSAPGIRAALVPRRVQRAAAHKAAMEQFMLHGLARKQNRAGILIFVSMTEHYARIVADDGIAAKVTQEVWQEAIDTLLSHLREGRITEGFVDAIDQCASVLATHFPPGEQNDELPDKIFVI
jgi:putative membrane protein